MNVKTHTKRAKRPTSLTLRATLLFGLIAALVVSAVGFYLYYSIEKELIRRADYQVSGRVQYFRQLLATDFPLTQLSHSPQLFYRHVDSDTNVVDVAVKRLRAKIDRTFDLKLIHTVRGIGYVCEVRP